MSEQIYDLLRGGHPGEDFNCRCWAEPVPGDANSMPSRRDGFAPPRGLSDAPGDLLTNVPVDGIHPAFSPFDLIGISSVFITRTGTKITITYAKKGIEKQIVKRGWTKEAIRKLVEKPHKKVKTRDIRRSRDGSRKNDPATAYFSKDGNYVVRNDKTGDVVQVSDKNDPNWISGIIRR